MNLTRRRSVYAGLTIWYNVYRLVPVNCGLWKQVVLSFNYVLHFSVTTIRERVLSLTTLIQYWQGWLRQRWNTYVIRGNSSWAHGNQSFYIYPRTDSHTHSNRNNKKYSYINYESKHALMTLRYLKNDKCLWRRTRLNTMFYQEIAAIMMETYHLWLM